MKIVVIGAGPAGIVISNVVKKLKPDYEVTVIGKEEHIVVRCSEVFAVSGDTTIDKIIKPDDVITSVGANLVREEVTEVDVNKKIVKTASGKEFNYDYLVFATGSRPFVPPVPGKDLNNVFSLRTAKDAEKIKSALEGAKNVVIIGGGMIGVELGALLSGKYHVSIVEMLPKLLYMAYDDEFCDFVEEELKKRGVRVITGKKVDSIKGEGKVSSVVVDGEEIPADVVIFATGVRPNKELAEKAGIAVEKFGIKTNERMQTSVENVYAVGDCAQSFSAITGEPAPSGLVSTAIAQAKVAAMNICGIDKKFDGVVGASAAKIFDISFGRVGLTEREAKKKNIDIVTGFFDGLNKYDTQKDPKPLKFKLIFNRKGEVIGGEIVTSGSITAGLIDLVSFAILNKVSIDKLIDLRYCAHPELTPLPFFDPIVDAATEAKSKLAS